MFIGYKCLPKMEWGLAQGSSVRESTIDSDGTGRKSESKLAGVSMSALTIIEQKEFVHLALAESNTKYQELQ